MAAVAVTRVGSQPVVVNGQNIDSVTLALQPGVTLSGNITVESSGTPAPADYSVFRVDVPEVNPLPFGGGGGGRGGGGPLAAAAARRRTGPSRCRTCCQARTTSASAAAACRAPGRQRGR